MGVLKSFNEIFNDVLTAYRNMPPVLQLDVVRLKTELPDVYNHYLVQTQPDLSEGTLLYIRSAVLASMLHGLRVEVSKFPDQVFAETAIRLYKERQAGELGVIPTNKTDAELASDLLDVKRSKRMGGNKYDYISWAKEVSVHLVMNNPYYGELTNHGFVSFNATAIVDGDTDTVGWSAFDSEADSNVVITNGNAVLRCYSKVRLYSNGQSDEVYEVLYSDDGVTWTSVATTEALINGWNELVWDSAGFHLHWQLKLTSVATAESDITEMEWFEGPEHVIDADVYPIAQGEGTFDVIITSSLNGGEASAELIDAVQDLLDDRRTVCSGFDWGLRVVTPAISYRDVLLYGSGSRWNPVQARLDIIAYLNSFLPGQTLYRTQLLARAVDNGSDNPSISTPSADVVPTTTPSTGVYGMIRPGAVIVS